MQKRNFLQNFDTKEKPSVNLEKNIHDIKQEQEDIYTQKLKIAKEALQKELLLKQQEELEIHKKKLAKEYHDKYIKEISSLQTQFDIIQTQNIENYTHIFDYFLNYYLTKLNKEVVSKEISQIIQKALIESECSFLEICGNQKTLDEISNNLPKNKDNKITLTVDDTLDEYVLIINHQDKCSLINISEIIHQAQEAFNTALVL